MILSGILADQAALMGVLNKLNCLNLTILSVKEADREAGEQAGNTQPASEAGMNVSKETK